MQIAKDSVVSLDYELIDSDGDLIEKTESPISYLHGGYQGIFPLVEQALDGKDVGHQCKIELRPEDAFGEYEAELLHVEPRGMFPVNAEIGMQFEGDAEDSNDHVVYTITDIADDKVVIDGNHPLAGQALIFSCTVKDVRAATSEELAHGHVHGEHGHHH